MEINNLLLHTLGLKEATELEELGVHLESKAKEPIRHDEETGKTVLKSIRIYPGKTDSITLLKKLIELLEKEEEKDYEEMMRSKLKEREENTKHGGGSGSFGC